MWPKQHTCGTLSTQFAAVYSGLVWVTAFPHAPQHAATPGPPDHLLTTTPQAQQQAWSPQMEYCGPAYTVLRGLSFGVLEFRDLGTAHYLWYSHSLTPPGHRMSTTSCVTAPLATHGGGRSTVGTLGAWQGGPTVPCIWVAAMAAAPARDVLLPVMVFCPAHAHWLAGACTSRVSHWPEPTIWFTVPAPHVQVRCQEVGVGSAMLLQAALSLSDWCTQASTPHGCLASQQAGSEPALHSWPRAPLDASLKLHVQALHACCCQGAAH